MRWVVIPLVLLAAGTVALVAGSGSDRESMVTSETETAVETSEDEFVSPRVRIAWSAENWAALFARGADVQDCRLMTQPLCERLDCKRVGDPVLIETCTPRSAEFRNSFADVTVADVAHRGGERAAARLSNGEVVELVLVDMPGVDEWWVDRVGGNVRRKYFGE